MDAIVDAPGPRSSVNARRLVASRSSTAVSSTGPQLAMAARMARGSVSVGQFGGLRGNIALAARSSLLAIVGRDNQRSAKLEREKGDRGDCLAQSRGRDPLWLHAEPGLPN